MDTASILSAVCGAVLVTLLLASGTAYLRASRRVWVGALAIGVSGVILFGMAYALFSAKTAIDELLSATATTSTHLEPLPDGWGPEFSLSERERYSLILARSGYLRHGIYRDYFDAAGTRRTFSPSADDKAARDQYLTNLRTIERRRQMAVYGLFALLAVGVAGIALGFTRGLSQLLALTNHSTGPAKAGR